MPTSSINNLEGLITALLESATTATGDASAPNSARDEIGEALFNLGCKQPDLFLSAAHAFLVQHIKSNGPSKAFILQIINRVLETEAVNAITDQHGLLIINLATQEMTMTKDNEDEWANAACAVLVTLSKNKRLCAHVMDAVLQKFPPAVTTGPHRYIAVALGRIAEHNAAGFVPFLTDVLSRTVPILTHMRTEQQRCTWATAIRGFCESVRECTDVTAADGTVPEKLNYSDQMEQAYDVIFLWMGSKEPKVRAAAADCVGELCLMMPSVRIHEELKKLVTTILSLYKKSTLDDQFLITQGLCRFLEAACSDDSCPLDSYLEEILTTLFPLICSVVEETDETTAAAATITSPALIRNQNEAFRCFHVTATRFADRIVYYLLHKMQHQQDVQKLGAINVLRHLLNSAGPYIEDKQSLVIMGLRPMLSSNDQQLSFRVKRAICQLCVALADHGYIRAEGGEHVISFLVRNLIPPDDTATSKKLPPLTEAEQAGQVRLQMQCAQALSTIASTCDSADKLLWPLLFEYICVESYSPVVADICKCLRILANRKRQEPTGEQLDFETGFQNPRVAGPQQVLSRLIVCASSAPTSKATSRRALEAIRLLAVISQWFHESMVTVVEERCASLIACVEAEFRAPLPAPEQLPSPTVDELPEKTSDHQMSLARWNVAILDLLSALVRSVNDGEWRCALAAAMAKQLTTLYGNSSDDKAFLARCIGGVLARIANTGFVTEYLVLLFRGMSHSNPVERRGCAQAVGFCASAHTDLVLTELENVAKWEHMKRSGGIFGRIKDAMPMRHYTDTEMIYLRAAIMLSYGYVVRHCPVDLVVQRIEQTVVVFLRIYMANTKQESVVRESIMETMYLIATSLDRSHLNSEYKFENRTEFFNYIKDCVKTENVDILQTSIRRLAAKATAALTKLDPPIPDNDLWELGNVLTSYIFPLAREKADSKTPDIPNGATLMNATMATYRASLEEFIRKKPVVHTLTQLLKILQPYYCSSSEHERTRAVDSTVLVLRVYFDNATDFSLGRASDFAPMASLLARLAPRVMDYMGIVRNASVRAVHWTFRLAYMQKGHVVDRKLCDDASLFCPDEFMTKDLMASDSGGGHIDAVTARKAIGRLAETIESRLPHCQMQTYLSGLFEMIGDRQNSIALAAAQLLSHSLNCRGGTLHAEAETLVSTLLGKLLTMVPGRDTYKELVKGLVAFAGHQLYVVVDVLVHQPLPYASSVIDSWQAVAREPSLCPSIVDYLLELLGTLGDAPWELADAGGGQAVRIVRPEACALAAALHEVFKFGQPDGVFHNRAPTLLAATLQLIAAMVDTKFPLVPPTGEAGKEAMTNGKQWTLLLSPDLRKAFVQPVAIATAALKELLGRLRADDAIQEMSVGLIWSDFNEPTLFLTSVGVLARSMSDSNPLWVKPLAELLTDRIDGVGTGHDTQRAAAIAVLSAFVRKHPDAVGQPDPELLRMLVKAMVRGLTDQSVRVRKLSIRGLGDLAAVSSDELVNYSDTAIDAAMSALDGTDDRKDEVAMEAVTALNKLATRVDNAKLSSICLAVLLKLRPCFEKESGSLRAVAFSLFGELGARIGESEEYREHLHMNLVSLMLHLNDEDEEVQKACRHAIQAVAKLLEVEAEVEKFLEQKEIYTELLKSFCRKMVLTYPDRINHYVLNCTAYFRAESPRIRANSAAMTGFLLAALTQQLRGTISKDAIFSGLIDMLKDGDSDVRIATARAIAGLHKFG